MMWQISTLSILLYLFAQSGSQTTDDLNSSVVTEVVSTSTTEYNFISGKPKPCLKKDVKSSATLSLSSNESTLNVENDYCLFVIQPENKTEGISLFFHALFLHESDNVTLYKNESDARNGNNSIIKPLSASNSSVTIVTNETVIVIKLMGTDKSYKRIFSVMYESGHSAIAGSCHFDISSKDLYIVNSPIHADSDAKELSCQYTYNNHNHNGITASFIFDQFNFTAPNKFHLEGSTLNGDYTYASAVDFFPIGQNSMTITVHMTLPTDETYQLRIHRVNENCSRSDDISGSNHHYSSPPNILNNGSIINECVWIFKIQDGDGQTLGIEFKDLHFENALDIIAINDGASENSQPLLQVTTSSVNSTKIQPIRTTGRYVWMTFKPVTFESYISFDVSVHKNGGHSFGNGTIVMKQSDEHETVFQLEVNSNQLIALNFTSSEIIPPGKLTIYDGFDKSTVLATLQGNIWYPLLSKSSKMMIIATEFAKSSFTAYFNGVSPGCFHASSLSSGDYVLSGNCNTTCNWIIPPQHNQDSVLLLDLQFVSLGMKDQIEIVQLDDDHSRIGVISPNQTYVPQLVIPANIGALLTVNRGPCKKEQENTVLIGHSSYVPVCGKNLTLDALEEFQITSPLYPNTYPVYASCHWNLSTPKENLVHLVFDTFKLAPKHFVKVSHSSDNKTEQYSGNELPDDIFLTGDSVLEFSSVNEKGKKLSGTLKSSSGFVVNGTVTNCGTVLSKKASGEFNVPVNKSLCIWKVSIPETDSNANVNIISYTVAKKDSSGNYELLVYDGLSVREHLIGNNSLDTEIWSRTSNLIFVYKRIDATKTSSVLSIKYSTIVCNETMQCDNKVCLHPDWRCNGVNECGDFSDERNCQSVPIPPENKIIGYSALAFWLTIMIMFATGIFLGITGPFCYQKYKNGQYRRFGDISIIE